MSKEKQLERVLSIGREIITEWQRKTMYNIATNEQRTEFIEALYDYDIMCGVDKKYWRDD